MTGRELLDELNRLPSDQLNQPAILRNGNGTWVELQQLQPNSCPVSAFLSNGNYIKLS